MKTIKLNTLKKEDVPLDLRAETYFDFNAHPFKHQGLFNMTDSVYGAILSIKNYAANWIAETIQERHASVKEIRSEDLFSCKTIGRFMVLVEDGAIFEPARIVGTIDGSGSNTIFVGRGTLVIGADFYLDQGSIYIGAGSRLESCGIKGPVIIGDNTIIGQGTYLRNGCIIGDECIIRGEIKNCLLMNRSNFPHPSYLGDSLCGYMSHFGNQATTANISIYAGLQEAGRPKPIILHCEGNFYDLGHPKMGICMGDFCQVGCNSVSDPGTFLKPRTVVYPLTRITHGFYGPDEVLKNKPIEHGVVERVKLK
jgi:hypothetical protein